MRSKKTKTQFVGLRDQTASLWMNMTGNSAENVTAGAKGERKQTFWPAQKKTSAAGWNLR